MAAFRKSRRKIGEDEDENREEGEQFSIQTFDEGVDLCEKISTGIETDEEVEVDDEEVDKAIGQELQAQGSATLKRKRKAWQKSSWPQESIDEFFNIICDYKYYRNRLIFTNNKASKYLEIYSKIVEEVKACFNVTPIQTRTKFKSCVATCKKASMTIKCGSGIANFMDQKPAWFRKLYPFVESQDSCDPSLTSEPSFAASSESNSDTGETTDSLVFADATPSSLPKDKALLVRTPPKRMKKETHTSLLKEAVTAFNRFASKDPLNGMAEFLKEENEGNREHERRMMEMQMQIETVIISSNWNDCG